MNPTSQNPKAMITLPGRAPRDASELPDNVGGVKVDLFELPPATVRAFKRSDLQRLTPAQYAKLSEEIATAQAQNLIIDDVTPREVLEAMDKANANSAKRMLDAIQERDTARAAKNAYKAFENARQDYERENKLDPNSAATITAERIMREAETTWGEAEQAAKTALA